MSDDTRILIRDLSDEELIAEWHKWNNKIACATGWGAALSAADEFRKDCEREIQRRGIKIPSEEKTQSKWALARAEEAFIAYGLPIRRREALLLHVARAIDAAYRSGIEAAAHALKDQHRRAIETLSLNPFSNDALHFRAGDFAEAESIVRALPYRRQTHER